MSRNFLNSFPSPSGLTDSLNNKRVPAFREANGHVHTPFSFSSFSTLETLFAKAVSENIKVLGINDFFVTDGYESFAGACIDNAIFPLFNIEFIGLMKEEQKKGIRINDPNNPGRIYFSGKGLDYPFNPGFFNRIKLRKVVRESQDQMKEMIGKINEVLTRSDPSLSLSYDEVRSRYAMYLVRERHLARAIRELAASKFSEPEKQAAFLESIYGGKKPGAMAEDHAAIENEIRSNLLKSGGTAFVEERESTFMEPSQIIKIIRAAGGIPCYPVLLDDASGNITEFESDPEKLHASLSAMKVDCIELIPGRNDISVLKDFVRFFHKKNYLILFGTEHNAPGMEPLLVSARGGAALDDELKRTAWEGVCLVAAHQYLRAQGRQGYILPDGKSSSDQKKELSVLGHMVIEYFLIKYQQNETADK